MLLKKRRRILFDEFTIPDLKGFERTDDKDDKTEYLFLKAPKNTYTIYFDSGMPIYDQNILNGCKEGGTMEFKFSDRIITLYFPTRVENSKSLWFFNIEFDSNNDENLVLPGQVILNSIQAFHSKVNKRSSFMDVLEQIMLK